MKIAVDAMGGDHAPSEIVKGAIEAAQENRIQIVLVGDTTIIQPLLQNHPSANSQISLVNAPEVITPEEHPTKAVRTKRHSSIIVGLNMLRHGEASAFVSAGSTGAIVSASVFVLGKINGVERPALTILLPTPSSLSLLLDVGANADCKPAFLVNFAQLGKIYMEKVFNIKNPRVGLLTTGEEKMKGNRLCRESHKLLAASTLNFVGNVEGKDIARGLVDVIVTDGFTGNMVLKVIEGLGEIIFDFFEQILTSETRFRETAPLFKPVLGAFAKKLDYSEQGGAPLLGVNGNVIVAHGRSRAKAIKNAIYLAHRTAELKVAEAMIQGLSEQTNTSFLPRNKFSSRLNRLPATEGLK